MHRTLTLRLPGILAVLLFVLFACPQPAAAQTRIMPLGDSITGSPGCWRALLWNQLQGTGFTNIDFVGTLPPQGCGVAYDGDNEGHGGYLATNVADQNLLPGWLSATSPDIVLMHFGTNDVWSARTPGQILAAFSKLVDQMRASNPNMKILVAQIIPVAPGSCADCPRRTLEFNAAIPGWAASKSTTASPIVVVDQWTGFNPATDTSDGVHPNDAGIVKLANNWYQPLTQFLSNPGGGGGGDEVIADGTYRITPRDSPDKALDVAGHGTADNTNVLQWSYGGANNQRWTLTHLGDNVYRLTGVESGKALQVTSPSTANGTNVDIRTYTGAANQHWTISATSDGYYRLTPVSSSGSALEVSGNSTANGANVQQGQWTGGTNQQWTFQTP